MILKLDELKNVCSSILPAVESSELSLAITDTLSLEVIDNLLYLSVTNREYFLTVKLNDKVEEDLKATINASLFLKLISQTTTDTVELKVDSTSLILKGNGTYKLPLIFQGDELLELPKIEINNVTSSFSIEGSVLNSILTNNTKQLGIGTISKAVQKMYYVDEEGAITFTSGACVNNFSLPQKVKMMFNKRLVKLFKLFKDEKVDFELGHDAISNDIIQTKVRFKTNNICLTSILSCDDRMLNDVPVKAIRDRANKLYPYSASINKNNLIDSINRIKLFVSSSKSVTSYARVSVSKSSMKISDLKGENTEVVMFNGDVEALSDSTYDMCLDLVDLLAVLDVCYESDIQFNFGDNQAVTISRSGIVNVIPQVNLD